MDMDDDDIYGDDDEYVPQESTKMQDIDEGEEEGEEVEDDSDDDINFITDSKQDAKPESTSQQKSQASQNVRDQDGGKASGTPQPQTRSEHTPQPSVNRTATPLDDGRPGTEYPARHTSTLDPMNGNPVHPVTGKPIMESDLDTDFGTESTKPWRKPGADITDYFNYGFDEFTWASWCLKKQQMPSEVKQINQETEQMKAFVDGIGSGGMPQMPGANAAGGMPQMPGMPSEQDMAQMMQAMMSQGVDVTQMDQNQFMQMMMGGGGGGGNFQQGQQPPSGPAAFGGNNAGGGFQDGYSGRGRGRGGRRNW